ncbi:COMM domain-containing protein 2 [Zootermopsis nevadensis]|uniref:COMM domain-containing protein 2 n=1 Tax=Zootermopsis nevadensis TaxID=136037 RepID=A0A067RBQ1_ZOONE|nr:COMM domain-containing protein 2 [Zootermopsis nevadensis]KDR21157.1 COMM domain-containing protein 2 [Zootermopsis nevadensis]
MLLSLKEDHKQHISVLIPQPTNVLQDFCKMALDFLRKGPTPKLYQTAAQKLDVQPEVIQNAVGGLVNLLVESCKHQLSDLDFRDSVLTLGFSEEQQETLEVFYKGKKQEISDALSQLTLDLPHYHDLEWRFEVQLASRALQHQVTPLITMNLTLETKTPLASGSSTRKNIVLQTDPTNLVHITQVLEAALLENRGQHSRRIQRSFK